MPIDPETGRMSVSAHVFRIVYKYVSEKERSGRITHKSSVTMRRELLAWLRTCPEDPKRITAPHVQRYLDTKPAAATKLRTLSFIRGFCRWATLNNHMRSDPTMKILPPRTPKSAPRSLTLTDAAAVLAACRTSRDRVCVSLMLQEALRVAEVCAIELGDIDLRRQTLAVHGKGGRGGITRHVPLSDETAREVQIYLSRHPASAGALVRRYEGAGPLAPGTLSRIVSDIFRAAEVKANARDGKSAHALRHTALTDMVENGAPITAVQRMAGHESIATTQIYIKGVDPELRKWMGGRKYS